MRMYIRCNSRDYFCSIARAASFGLVCGDALHMPFSLSLSLVLALFISLDRSDARTGESRLPVCRWRTEASARRPDAACNRGPLRGERTGERERERERSCGRMILVVACRSSKFRLIAPPTAPARFYSKDAFRCPNIPTPISIHRPPDIIGSLDFPPSRERAVSS